MNCKDCIEYSSPFRPFSCDTWMWTKTKRLYPDMDLGDSEICNEFINKNNFKL